MIKKSFLSSFVLLLCYSYFSTKMKPGLFAPMTLMQQNKTQAELYILFGNSQSGVVLGSSMGTRLQMEFLPFYTNLSLGGMSIYDGFNILHAKGKIPPVVLVESNVLLRFENKELKKYISSKIRSKLHKKFPVFLAGKEPLNILSFYLQNCCIRPAILFVRFVLKKQMRYLRDIFSDRQIVKTAEKQAMAGARKEAQMSVSKKTHTRQKTSFYKKSLKLQIKENSKNPDPALLKQAMARMKQEVAFLKKHGAIVIFFEMPMDPRLCSLRTPVTYPKRLHLEFPDIPFIPQPDCSLYSTADAVHLEPVSAKRYTKYLKKKLDAILSSKKRPKY